MQVFSKEELKEQGVEFLPDECDEVLVGISDQGVAIYDYDLLVELYARLYDISIDESIEFIDQTISGYWEITFLIKLDTKYGFNIQFDKEN